MMSKLMKLMAATLLALGICGCSDDRLAGGGTDTEISILAGTVTKGGAAVYGATVQIDGSSTLSDLTDSTGTFVIDDVPYGSHTISASKQYPDGMYQYSQTVNVASENVSVGVLALTKTPVAKQAR